MPFPNEHSARLVSPDGFDDFRRTNEFFAPGIDAIFGLKGEGDDVVSTLQAIRFDKEKFTVAQARAWLTDNDFEPILFEPASEEVQESVATFPESWGEWMAQFRLTEAGMATKADGSCPAGYPVRRHDPETETMRCFKRMAENEHDEPRSEAGATVQQTLEAVASQGRKFSQEEAGFVEQAPSPDVVCGACRFYLRDPESEVGGCQVVEGEIPWFGTSVLYISAAAEAAAVFNAKSETPPEPTEPPKPE